jgi:senataxin
VDEAGQAVEPSTLIPLQCGAKKCILVGDPQQLPPTTLAQLSKQYLYDQSLFQRILNLHPKSAYMLNTQSRMHPDISRFPSKHFYNGRLLDDKRLMSIRRAEYHENRLFPPYRLYDIRAGREDLGSSTSFQNVEEANYCVQLVRKLAASYPHINVHILTSLSPRSESLRSTRSKPVSSKTGLKGSLDATFSSRSISIRFCD